MKLVSIKYKTGTAGKNSIEKHLLECSDSFVPPLNTYVDIPEYAKKLKKYSVTFEAWNNSDLVSLIACYLNNEKKSGFITNVSTNPMFQGKKITTQLFLMMFNYMILKNYILLSLEVNRLNTKAVNYYIKLGFKINRINSTTEKFNMFLNLNNK